MKTPLRKADLESALGLSLRWQPRPQPETIPTGIPEADAVSGGLPRGAITEICGPPSSGRTTLLLSVLAQAAARQETCALVDTAGAFDLASAAAAGLDLRRLLWVRCSGHAERALKAADLVAHSGGFGVVVFDLADVPAEIARRIPLASWYRLRRAIEHTPTALLLVEPQPWAKSCSSLILELTRERTAWSGRLLQGARLRLERRKSQRADSAVSGFDARALA
jgi:recombination protein RecA